MNAVTQKQKRTQQRAHSAQFFDRLLVLHGYRCHWCEEPVVRLRNVSRFAFLRVDNGFVIFRRHGKPVRVRLATIDHLMPLGLGGSPGPENLVIACAECNQIRNELAQLRLARDDWRAQLHAFADYCRNAQNRLRQRIWPPSEWDVSAQALFAECAAIITESEMEASEC